MVRQAGPRPRRPFPVWAWVIPASLLAAALWIHFRTPTDPSVGPEEMEVRVSGGHRGLTAQGESLLVFADPEPVDLESLIQNAEMVVGAKVESATPVMREDDSMLETHYTLTIRRPYKGSAPSIHEVVLPGGVLEEADGSTRRADIVGLGNLEVGKKYILFLGPPGDEGWSLPVGMLQGIVEVDEGVGRVLRRFHDGTGEADVLEDFRAKVTELANRLPAGPAIRSADGDRGASAPGMRKKTPAAEVDPVPEPVLEDPAPGVDPLVLFLMGLALISALVLWRGRPVLVEHKS